jgi:hypothetical protein
VREKEKNNPGMLPDEAIKQVCKEMQKTGDYYNLPEEFRENEMIL